MTDILVISVFIPLQQCQSKHLAQVCLYRYWLYMDLKSFGNYTNFVQDEKTKCNKYADELAKMELKWKEQVKIAENIKLELAEVVDSYKVSLIFI